MGEPAAKTLLTTTKKTSITIDDVDVLRDILRKHFNMPDAELKWDLGLDGYFLDLTLTSTQVETTESPFDVGA